MEIRKAVIVLADIGGYTRFIKKHDVSLMHAERIISELMEQVMDAADYPLTVNKLEGDAALFYATADRDPSGVAQSALRQANGIITAFNRRRDEMEANRMCTCQACTDVGNLRIKAVLHYGEVAIKRIRHFEELAGETVIVAHRLMKNSVEKDEYLLVTEAFDKQAGGFPGQAGTRMTEDCEGIGKVNTVVYDPSHEMLPAIHKAPLPVRLWQLSGLVLFTFARKLGFGQSPGLPSLQGL